MRQKKKKERGGQRLKRHGLVSCVKDSGDEHKYYRENVKGTAVRQCFKGTRGKGMNVLGYEEINRILMKEKKNNVKKARKHPKLFHKFIRNKCP